MKRFLEYLEDVRRGRALSEGKFDRPYRLEKADLADGRKYVELREADFKDALRNDTMTRFFGPRVLMPTQFSSVGRSFWPFEKVGKFIKLPPAKVKQLEPEAGDTFQFGVVNAGETVTCASPADGEPGGAGLFGLFAKDGWFKRGFVFQMSFNECVNFILAALDDEAPFNPMMPFKLLNSELGVFEDEEENAGVQVRTPPSDYSRADVLKFVQNPRSHFNDARHKARRDAYRAQIVSSKGELGEVVVLNQAKLGTTTQYDNLLTDQNWIVSLDPQHGGRVADLMRASVRKLVQMCVYGRKTANDMSAYKKWIPRKRLFTACRDEAKGRIV